MKPTKICQLHSFSNLGRGNLVAHIYIVEDTTGKFFPNQSVRTSLVVSHDVENKSFETLNTIYKYQWEN